MSLELKPKWDGIIGLDEKMCRVRGRQQWFYLASDTTGDVIDCRAVKELTVNEAITFLEGLKTLGLKVRAMVTDLDTVLTLAVEKVYPQTPHQYCIKHALAAIEEILGYKPIAVRRGWNQRILRNKFERLAGRKGIWRERAQEEFRSNWEAARQLSQHYRSLHRLWEAARTILTAQTEQEAQTFFRSLRHIQTDRDDQRKKVVAFFRRHWDRLMMHHRVRGLPRTNNLAENLNKQLERRFKTIESFQSPSSAKNYVNLLIAYLRQKPYTDCRGRRKYLNGKSRLEAAGLSLPSLDWLVIALKPPKNSNR